MNSFTSHFKGWIAAIILLVGIEVTVQMATDANPLNRTNLLQFSFGTPETPQRLFMHHKFIAFADSEPTFVQSGDSSGFYGIDPRQVMEHLPDSMSYVNMSCCANLGFRGYLNTFEFMLRRNPSIEYIVLHITPYTMPSRATWGRDGAALWGPADIRVFGEAVGREYTEIWRYLHLPTMQWRRDVTDYTFSAGGRFADLRSSTFKQRELSTFPRSIRVH